MRFLLLLPAALIAPASAAAPEPSPLPAAPSVEMPRTAEQAECRRPTSYHANQGSAWRGAPLGPRKLTELPPATGYMAVYRTIDGCEEPLTVVEYRTGRRP